MESIYEIGIELICNTGNANLYNFGRKATQYDFKALNFKSISILYLGVQYIFIEIQKNIYNYTIWLYT